MRAREADTRVPEIKKVVNEWSQVMANCCQGRLSWTRNNTGEIHVLGFVMNIWREIETEH